MLGGPRDLGTSAVALDDTGHYEALAAAEFLISKGLVVIFVTRFPSIAPYVDIIIRTVPAPERRYKNASATSLPSFLLLEPLQVAHLRRR